MMRTSLASLLFALLLVMGAIAHRVSVRVSLLPRRWCRPCFISTRAISITT